MTNALRRHLDVAKLLLQHEVHLKNEKDIPALCVVADLNLIGLTKLLIEYGGDFDGN